MIKIKRLFIVSSLIACSLLFAVNANKLIQSDDSKNLYVYNWGDYIDPQLITKFEQESGYHVIYETYDSNEAMYLKVKSGASPYDVIFPSEYMVDKMRQEQLLLPLNYELLPNSVNLSPQFLDNDFDPKNEYSLPYFWGTLGILYNTKLYDQLELAYPTTYSDLWNPGLIDNILLVDGAREVVGSSLNSLSYSLNSSNLQQLAKAEQNLYNLAPNVKGVVGDEIKMLLANDEAAAAIVWSGDAKLITSENSNTQFITPQISNIYLDNIAIPTTAQNVEGAHQFINFLLDENIAQLNEQYVGYSSPISSVMQQPENAKDESYYPSASETEKLEYYLNLEPELLKKYNDIFLRFKISL